jgi:hypothetical protein
MGMGTRRRRQRQEQIWIAHQEVSKGPAHPFYAWVNELLEEKNFDKFAEKECAKFYADSIGRDEPKCSFSTSKFGSRRNRRYLRYKPRHLKTSNCATGC